MKKRLLIILTILLCVSLAACNLVPPAHSGSSDNSGSSESTESSDPNLSEKIYFPLEKESPPTDKKYIPSNPDYDIQIVVGTLNKPSHIKAYPDEEIVSDPTQYTIQIGKKEFQAYHAKIWYGADSATHIFYNEDNSMQYRMSTVGNCFSVISQNESGLVRYEGNDFSEEALLNFIKNYISSFVDISNIDDYTYSCITQVSVSTPQHDWTENRDGFYISEDLISENSTEEVKVHWYIFNFIKYCNGYPTGDCITVYCTADGDIDILHYKDYGVNWNDYAVFTKPDQMDKIKKQIADYLPRSIDDKWILKSFEPGEPKLVYEEGEVKLSITYGLKVESGFENGGGASGLCHMMVAIE